MAKFPPIGGSNVSGCRISKANPLDGAGMREGKNRSNFWGSGSGRVLKRAVLYQLIRAVLISPKPLSGERKYFITGSDKVAPEEAFSQPKTRTYLNSAKAYVQA